MAVSQNGYSANDRSVITQYVVSNSGRTMNLRKGSPGELLAHAIRWFDSNIRDIDPGIMDDWSYAERPIRGGVELSNHASGTAGDVDATKWPLGANPEAYLTADEISRWREHLKLYEGCIRWGGDYDGRKDPMHVEINRDQATCDRVWAKIKGTEEEFTVSQYDAIMATLSNIRDDGWKQHSDSQTVRATYHAQTQARIAALTELVSQLQSGKSVPVDLDAIEAAGRRGAESALKDLRIQVNTGDVAGPA